MARPLHRGVLRLSSGNSHELWESEAKERTGKEDLDKNHSSDQGYLTLRSPFQFLFRDNSNSPSKYGVSENGFASDPFSAATPRGRHNLTLLLLKCSLVVIIILAFIGSFWWTISISTASRGHVYHGYRRLQEQLVSDLYDIGEISVGSSRTKELEFCSQESENYVPCFNVTESMEMGYTNGEENDRNCGHRFRQNCLTLPPVNYKIPLRWPAGRDMVWVANVKITAEEMLSSGSFTKR